MHRKVIGGLGQISIPSLDASKAEGKTSRPKFLLWALGGIAFLMLLRRTGIVPSVVTATDIPADLFGWPILKRDRKIGSPFGMRGPIPSAGLLIPHLHPGQDFPAKEGTPVFAATSGRIVDSYFSQGGGNTVKILHAETGVITRYFHLSKRLVDGGANVQKGQLIGLVGSTGTWSTGPHLHFETMNTRWTAKGGVDAHGAPGGMYGDPLLFLNRPGTTEPAPVSLPIA